MPAGAAGSFFPYCLDHTMQLLAAPIQPLGAVLGNMLECNFFPQYKYLRNSGRQHVKTLLFHQYQPHLSSNDNQVYSQHKVLRCCACVLKVATYSQSIL